MTVGTRIQLRRDTAANWTSANPTLLSGEPAVETDTGKEKIGDGSTAWTALAYLSAGRVYRIVGTSGRPTTTQVPAGFVEYVASSTPTDWVSGDTWINTA